MKKFIFLISLCALCTVSGMEKESEKEITSVPKKEDLSELELYMANYVVNIAARFTAIYARTALVEDFTHSNYNHVWKDLESLTHAVEKRKYYKVRKQLKNYRSQTQRQLHFFAQGLKLLAQKNVIAENFRQNIENKLPSDYRKFFNKKFCTNKVTPHEWLQLRTCALELVQQKLLVKTWKERALAKVETAPTCIQGTACGIGIMTITSATYWPLGALGIMLSSCLFLGCPQEVYDDCRPSKTCSNNEDIADLLQNSARFLNLDASKILTTVAKRTECTERDALLAHHDQKSTKPIKGSGLLNSKWASVNG